MKEEIPKVKKNQAIILLLVLIAIGGIVLFGQGEPERLKVKVDQPYAPER